MTDFMLGFGLTDVALTLNREVLGVFFAISGYHKLFNVGRHKSITDTLVADGVPLVTFNEWFVPIVEMLGGLALVVGLLTIPAALGCVAICTVATCVDGFKRIKSWSPIDKADAVDDVLYLPEVLYIVMLLVVVFAGPGPYSIDAVLFR